MGNATEHQSSRGPKLQTCSAATVFCYWIYETKHGSCFRTSSQRRASLLSTQPRAETFPALSPQTPQPRAAQDQFHASSCSEKCHLRILMQHRLNLQSGRCSLWALRHETTREGRPLLFGFTSNSADRGSPVWCSSSRTRLYAFAYLCHFVTSSLLSVSLCVSFPSVQFEHSPPLIPCVWTWGRSSR